MLNLLSIPKIQSKMSARDKRNVFNITLGKTNDLKHLIKETHIPEQLKNLIQIFNSKTQKWNFTSINLFLQLRSQSVEPRLTDGKKKSVNLNHLKKMI